MPTTVKIRRSGTASATPSALEHGEIAINYADGKVFWKNASNVITSFTFQSYALASHGHAASDITINFFGGAVLEFDGSDLSQVWLPIDAALAARPTTTSYATSNVGGVVKVGAGVTITNGVISVSTNYAATSHTHGNITNAGAIGSTSGQIVVTTTSGVLTTASTISTSQVSGLGTLATQSGTFSGTSSGTNTGDEVAEYATTSAFPATGNTTLLYLATDASRAYRWTGSEYVEVGPTSLSGASSGPSLALVLALS